jgi:hypothetical protein
MLACGPVANRPHSVCANIVFWQAGLRSYLGAWFDGASELVD